MVVFGVIGGGQKPLLARWTSDFDCGYETEWWYTIKDTPFDITKLKAKKRYYVNQGIKNFEFRKINPKDYLEELAEVQEKAFSAYPSKYRPVFNRQRVIDSFRDEVNDVFAVFRKTTNQSDKDLLCGYSILGVNNRIINYSVHKTIPKYEKLSVNHALVYGVLSYYEEKISNGYYLSNGQRSTNHETNFNKFLEEYFGWRKAYCKLHMAYHPKIAWIIKILYPMRSLLKKINSIGIIHKVKAILFMEEIARNCKK